MKQRIFLLATTHVVDIVLLRHSVGGWQVAILYDDVLRWALSLWFEVCVIPIARVWRVLPKRWICCDWDQIRIHDLLFL